MLVSVEHELPAYLIGTRQGVPPDVFQELWKRLAEKGWQNKGLLVTRTPSDAATDCITPDEVLTTDTGPTLEIVPTPAHSITILAPRLHELRKIAVTELTALGAGLLGSGIHPCVSSSEDDYDRLRTPRKAYD